MNLVFTELVNDYSNPNDSILYLDSQEMHTTIALRSRFGITRKLFTANCCEETFVKLEKSGKIDQVEKGAIENLLMNKWKSENFNAAYFDLCTGSASIISQVLSALLSVDRKCSIIGFTMTQRDPQGYNQVERLDKIESLIRHLRPKMFRITDAPKFKDTVWVEGGVVTRFYSLCE